MGYEGLSCECGRHYQVDDSIGSFDCQCGRQYEREYHPQLVGGRTISKGKLAAAILVPAIAGNLLGAFIFGGLPSPGESPQERVEKIKMTTGTLVVSGFVGLLAYVIASESQ